MACTLEPCKGESLDGLSNKPLKLPSSGQTLEPRALTPTATRLYCCARCLAPGPEKVSQLSAFCP